MKKNIYFRMNKRGSVIAIMIFVILVILLCFGSLYYFILHNNKIADAAPILASTSYLNLQEQRVDTEFRVLMDQAVVDAYMATLKNMSKNMSSDSGQKFFVIDTSTTFDFVYKKLFTDNLNSSITKLLVDYKKDTPEENQLGGIVNTSQITFDGKAVSVVLKNFFLNYTISNETYVNYSFDVVYSNSLDKMGLLGLSDVLAMKKSCGSNSDISSCLSLYAAGFKVTLLAESQFNKVDRKVFDFNSGMQYFVQDSLKNVKFDAVF